MSLDFSLIRRQPQEVAHANITHNMTELWYALGIYEILYNGQGKYASDVYNQLHRALLRLEVDRAKWEAYDSPNGWGTYDGALRFLTIIVKACEEFPNARIDIDK